MAVFGFWFYFFLLSALEEDSCLSFTVKVSCSFHVAVSMGRVHIHHKYTYGDAGIHYTGGLAK